MSSSRITGWRFTAGWWDYWDRWLGFPIGVPQTCGWSGDLLCETLSHNNRTGAEIQKGLEGCLYCWYTLELPVCLSPRDNLSCAACKRKPPWTSCHTRSKRGHLQIEILALFYPQGHACHHSQNPEHARSTSISLLVIKRNMITQRILVPENFLTEGADHILVLVHVLVSNVSVLGRSWTENLATFITREYPPCR